MPTQNKSRKPSVSYPVHYVGKRANRCIPAVIHQVNKNSDEVQRDVEAQGNVQLTILSERYEIALNIDRGTGQVGTWHYPDDCPEEN